MLSVKERHRAPQSGEGNRDGRNRTCRSAKEILPTFEISYRIIAKRGKA